MSDILKQIGDTYIMDYILLFISSMIFYLIEEETLEKRFKLRTKIIKLCKKELFYFIFIVVIVWVLYFIVNCFSVQDKIKYVLYGLSYGTGIFFLKVYRLKE